MTTAHEENYKDLIYLREACPYGRPIDAFDYQGAPTLHFAKLSSCWMDNGPQTSEKIKTSSSCWTDTHTRPWRATRMNRDTLCPFGGRGWWSILPTTFSPQGWNGAMTTLDLCIAHKWAHTPGPKPNPQWAMGPIFKAQPNPQPINGGP